jgi:hypothetical protein
MAVLLDHRDSLDLGRPHVPIRQRRETIQVRMQARVHPREEACPRNAATDFFARTGAVEATVLAGRRLNVPAACLLDRDRTRAGGAGHVLSRH